MAKSSIKVRAKLKKGVTIVKCLMTHPMEPGNRKDKKTGKEIKPHFITEVTCKHNNNAVVTAVWSGGISKNPYLSCEFEGAAKGDAIEIAWVDNQGNKDSVSSTIR